MRPWFVDRAPVQKLSVIIQRLGAAAPCCLLQDGSSASEIAGLLKLACLHARSWAWSSRPAQATNTDGPMSFMRTAPSLRSHQFSMFDARCKPLVAEQSNKVNNKTPFVRQNRDFLENRDWLGCPKRSAWTPMPIPVFVLRGRAATRERGPGGRRSGRKTTNE